MYTFNVLNYGTYHISIEKHTQLLVLEWEVDGEEYPRYIRMTRQQVDKFRNILFGANFTSSTLPTNTFKLDSKNGRVSITCHEENQTIYFPLNAFKFFDKYYNGHKQFVAKFDASFRSRK